MGEGETGSRPAEELEALYERLSSRSPVEALGFQGQPAPELLLRRIEALKAEVARLFAGETGGLEQRVLARLSELERLIHDPLEWFILVRADTMGLDPQDPGVRRTLEASFLERHVPAAVWLAHTVWHDADSRDAARVPVPSYVELHGQGQRPIRVRIENLSKTGLCAYGVPPSWQGGPLVVQLPLVGRPAVRLEGEQVWRRDDRVGVRFRQVPFAEGLGIEKAIEQHHREILALAERYLELAPTDPAAIASAFLARWFVAATDGERASLLEQLAEKANEHPRAADLQLALAKVCLAAGQPARFERSLARARTVAPGDPRVAQLSRSLGTSAEQGRVRLGLREKLAETPAAGVLLLAGAAVFSAGYLVLRLGSPIEDVAVDVRRGLPCVSSKLAGPTLYCEVEPAGYLDLPSEARKAKAEITLSQMQARGATSVLVVATGGAPVLETFGDLPSLSP